MQIAGCGTTQAHGLTVHVLYSLTVPHTMYRGLVIPTHHSLTVPMHCNLTFSVHHELIVPVHHSLAVPTHCSWLSPHTMIWLSPCMVWLSAPTAQMLLLYQWVTWFICSSTTSLLRWGTDSMYWRDLILTNHIGLGAMSACTLEDSSCRRWLHHFDHFLFIRRNSVLKQPPCRKWV